MTTSFFVAEDVEDRRNNLLHDLCCLSSEIIKRKITKSREIITSEKPKFN